jgi:hypothetical protein
LKGVGRVREKLHSLKFRGQRMLIKDGWGAN